MIKKIVLFFICFLFIFTTIAVANPVSMEGEGGVIGEFSTADTPVVQGDSVIIYKEITAYNPETCVVNAPAITYTYTISADNASKDIYDIDTAHNPAANAHATTKAGVGSPTITGTITLAPDTNTLNASAAGTKNTFPITIDFSGIDFTTAGSGAGIYRYVITETCTEAAKNAAGISDGTISNVRYLDVYVDGDGNIYGYVCLTYNNSIDARNGATTNTVMQSVKTEGFVAGSDTSTSPAVDKTADAYYTFNFEVSKTVQNDAYSANTAHEFPFTITLVNANVTANVLPIMTITGDATQTALTASTISTVWTPTIGNGAVISYVGIPCGTSISIKETNDVIGITYISSSANADTDASTKNIDTGTDSNNASINCTTHITEATENHTSTDAGTIIFTNTLLQISPTGIAMRFGPYVLILLVGIILLVIGHYRREERDQY